MVQPGKQLNQLLPIMYGAERSPPRDNIAVNQRAHGKLATNLGHKLLTESVEDPLKLLLGREVRRIESARDRLVRRLGLLGAPQTLLRGAAQGDKLVEKGLGRV